MHQIVSLGALIQLLPCSRNMKIVFLPIPAAFHFRDKTKQNKSRKYFYML